MSDYTKSHPLVDCLHPLDNPLGEDGHQSEAAFTRSDEIIADKLAWHIGYVFDINPSSLDQWKAVVRALRVHGLEIVDAPRDVRADGK